MTAAVQTDHLNGTIRKIQWRILPFLIVLYIIAFIDRSNIGFAALKMNPDLGITST
ncbi:MFS transporter, partial [Escherichia coli]|nr:MFS transporter [Escherichia coli]